MAGTAEQALTPALPEGAAAITGFWPRDGLQGSPAGVASCGKATFAACYVAAGIAGIEAASFIRPDPVPRLAGAVTP